jgi:hypothetical protein
VSVEHWLPLNAKRCPASERLADDASSCGRYNAAEDDEFKPMVTSTSSPIATCLALTTAISKSRTVDEIYEAALDALRAGLGVERASILLFDADGVMRFKAYRGLSDAYRQAVEGHTPWRPDSPDPQPIWVSDVASDRSCDPYALTLAAEGINALAFIPLISQDRVIGKFMLYLRRTHSGGGGGPATRGRNRGAGGVRRRAHEDGAAGSAKRGTLAFRAGRRIDGDLGLGPLDQRRRVVRQLGPHTRVTR